jgi:hypothetical protein
MTPPAKGPRIEKAFERVRAVIANALACRVPRPRVWAASCELGPPSCWRISTLTAHRSIAPRRSTDGSRLLAAPDTDSATSTTDCGYSLPTAHHLRLPAHTGQKTRPTFVAKSQFLL